MGWHHSTLYARRGLNGRLTVIDCGSQKPHLYPLPGPRKPKKPGLNRGNFFSCCCCCFFVLFLVFLFTSSALPLFFQLKDNPNIRYYVQETKPCSQASIKSKLVYMQAIGSAEDIPCVISSISQKEDLDCHCIFQNWNMEIHTRLYLYLKEIK